MPSLDGLKAMENLSHFNRYGDVPWYALSVEFLMQRNVAEDELLVSEDSSVVVEYEVNAIPYPVVFSEYCEVVHSTASL